MKVLSISVLVFIVLALSVSGSPVEKASVAQADVAMPQEVVSVDANGAAPPAESPDFGDVAPLTQYLGQCPFGWYGHEGRCYQFVNRASTWINAQQYCMGIGANLASARNPREYRFLQEMVDEIGQNSRAWLGGFYLQNTWLWMDGEGFYYHNWHSHFSGSTYPCLYLQTRAGWSNNYCHSTIYPFVCVKRTC